MALSPKPDVCFRHGWAGREIGEQCPQCLEIAAAEEARWQALTQDQKIEELRQQIRGLALRTTPLF